MNFSKFYAAFISVTIGFTSYHPSAAAQIKLPNLKVKLDLPNINQVLFNIGDAVGNLTSFGETGRRRDLERAQAEARFEKMRAELLTAQLETQISFLKEQLSLTFRFYCEDQQRLLKVQQIQEQTLSTMLLFQRAYVATKKMANKIEHFGKLNEQSIAELENLQNALAQTLDTSTGKSFLDLNSISGQIYEIAKESGQDVGELINEMSINLFGSQQSATEALKTINLLLTNTYLLISNFEKEIVNQNEKTLSLQQGLFTQLVILDLKEVPLLTNHRIFNISKQKEEQLCHFTFASEADQNNNNFGSPAMVFVTLRDTIRTRISGLQNIYRVMDRSALSTANGLKNYKDLTEALELSILTSTSQTKDFSLSDDETKNLRNYILEQHINRLKIQENIPAEQISLMAQRSLEHFLYPLGLNVSVSEFLSHLPTAIIKNLRKGPNLISDFSLAALSDTLAFYQAKHKIPKPLMLRYLFSREHLNYASLIYNSAVTTEIWGLETEDILFDLLSKLKFHLANVRYFHSSLKMNSQILDAGRRYYQGQGKIGNDVNLMPDSSKGLQPPPFPPRFESGIRR